MTIRFLSEAEAELDEAVGYYNAQLPRLGAEFAAEVREALGRVGDHPRAWQRLGGRIGRYRLHRFPYGLIYATLPSEIIVVAVMHLHRKPDYWRKRLRQV